MISLAYKDIRHTLSKFLVTAIGVGMLLGIVLIMLGVYRGMAEDARILLNDIRADLWVVQQGTLGPFAESSRLHQDWQDSLKAFDGVTHAAALTFQNVQLYNRQQQAIRVLAVGYDPMGDFSVIAPQRLVAGRSLRAQHYEMVVTDKTGFQLGERVPLGRDLYRVVGITHGTVSSSGDPLIYLSLKDAQTVQFSYTNAHIRNDRARGLLGQNTRLVNTVVLKVAVGKNPTEVAQALALWKPLSVYSHQEQGLILSRNVIERSSKQIGLFTAILVLVSGIIIGLIIYTMTLEKMKEISIMKLIGIPNGMVVRMIMQETLLLGALAFLFGNLFATLIAGQFPKRVELLGSDALLLFLVILLASFLASLVGVYKVMRADPAAAIGG
ncbi:MAG: ABC transporter permease [Thiotrichales bacterium]|nr:ABC transporter permease [Thiotrichales bacterium]